VPVSNGNRGVYEEFEELDESRGEKNGRTIRGKVLILLVLLFTNFCAHLPEDLCDFRDVRRKQSVDEGNGGAPNEWSQDRTDRLRREDQGAVRPELP
jgi:hypothetical protein